MAIQWEPEGTRPSALAAAVQGALGVLMTAGVLTLLAAGWLLDANAVDAWLRELLRR